MKKILKTMAVFLLSLVTLVSCNRNGFKAELSFADYDEFKRSINSAKIDGKDEKRGVYVFNENAKGELNPSKVSYSFETYTTKGNRDNMTKNNIVINEKSFNFYATLEFTDEEGKIKDKMIISSTASFLEDGLHDALSNGKLQLSKSTNKLFEEYDQHYAIGYNLTEGEDEGYRRVACISCNRDYDTLKDLAFKIIPYLEFVNIGQ